MTTIANYENIERAEVARSLLADCGIAAFIPDDFLVTYRGTVGGIRVQVSDEDREAALKILAAKEP